MSRKHMKRRLTSLVTREMPVETTVRYHITPISLAILQKQKIISVDEDVEILEPSYTVG